MTTSKHLADLRALESENARLRADLADARAENATLRELVTGRAQHDAIQAALTEHHAASVKFWDNMRERAEGAS